MSVPSPDSEGLGFLRTVAGKAGRLPRRGHEKRRPPPWKEVRGVGDADETSSQTQAQPSSLFPRRNRRLRLRTSLLASGSSSGRAFPSLISGQWHPPTFVTGHSGGSATDLHRLPWIRKRSADNIKPRRRAVKRNPVLKLRRVGPSIEVAVCGVSSSSLPLSGAGYRWGSGRGLPKHPPDAVGDGDPPPAPSLKREGSETASSGFVRLPHIPQNLGAPIASGRE